jgi:hypothetical protein
MTTRSNIEPSQRHRKGFEQESMWGPSGNEETPNFCAVRDKKSIHLISGQMNIFLLTFFNFYVFVNRRWMDTVGKVIFYPQSNRGPSDIQLRHFTIHPSSI